jgi:8-amino-7-oxononanoate synthase
VAGIFGISEDTKRKLISGMLARRPAPTSAAAPGIQQGARPPLGDPQRYEEIRLMRAAAAHLDLANPYFKAHEGIAGATACIGNRQYINFASYNYCGLNGDPRVQEAAISAMATFGTSAGASRLVAGERPLHAELERALADHYAAEDCVVMVSGHATNVTVIGHLLSAGDLVLHDALAHNSIVQGCVLSGARRVPFPHNDLHALERLLERARPMARQALIVVEGHYSMDGDVPDLAGLIALARRYDAHIMVDEAHSLGVLGATGRGIFEHCGVDLTAIDIWMGTLSKTLAGCGGYIAGNAAMVEYLRHTAPGFVYSVGMSPPLAAAALAALRALHAEPQRVAQLRANGALFLAEARARSLDTGTSIGAAIVPVVIGSSIRTARAAEQLFERGVNVQPIIHPAVPERTARLRFFLSSQHEPEQIREAVRLTAEAVAEAKAERIPLAEVIRLLASH